MFVIILLTNFNFHDFEKLEQNKVYQKLGTIQDSFLVQREATLNF